MTHFDMPEAGTWEQRGGWMVRRLEKDLGLTLEQAAGLVGNLGYESAQFKTLQEIKPLIPGSKGGFGIAQWTGVRRRNFEAWCSENGLYPHSMEANYGFLLHELRGDYKSFADRLRRALSVADASRLTHKEYETPSDVLDGTYRSGAARLRLAERALAGALDRQSVDDVDQAPLDDMPNAVTPWDKLKAIQLVLGVKQDADFRTESLKALNAVLSKAGQRTLRLGTAQRKRVEP